MGNLVLVGSPQPKTAKGVSALHPSFLEYDALSGEVEPEGSRGQGGFAKFEGKLKVLGYEEQEVINAKTT